MSNLSSLFDRYKALVIFDTETSGLNPEDDQIIELAALRVERTAAGALRIAGKMDTFIKLPEGEQLPENIVTLTGITDRLLETEGVQSGTAVSRFLKLVKPGPVLMVAHNAQFDACFLRELLRGFKPGHLDWLDSLTVYKDRRPYVDEGNRSWCTSSNANDQRAVTIEVASDATHPYAVKDKAYEALLDLVTDICKRNGIKKLVWSANKNDRVNHLNGCNMTVHRDYAAKACPGDYLYNLHDEIAAEVNKRLGASGGSSTPSTGGNTTAGDIKVGDEVEFTGTRHYVSATATASSACKPGKAKVTAIAKGKAHPYHLIAVSGGGSTVYGWTDAADIKTSAATATSYLVKVTTDVLNIRKGPGTNYGTNGDIRDKGVYTIVAESDGPGASKWGKLKSGAGWISLDYTKKV